MLERGLSLSAFDVRTSGPALEFPEHTQKPGAVACVCNVSVPMLSWAVEARESLCEQASLEHATVNDEETLSSVRWRVGY